MFFFLSSFEISLLIVFLSLIFFFVEVNISTSTFRLEILTLNNISDSVLMIRRTLASYITFSFYQEIGKLILRGGIKYKPDFWSCERSIESYVLFEIVGGSVKSTRSCRASLPILCCLSKKYLSQMLNTLLLSFYHRRAVV